MLARMNPEHIAMFRFLLEARDNLALFTVLEKRPALLKIIFSPNQEKEVRDALEEIGQSIPLSVEEWPLKRF